MKKLLLTFVISAILGSTSVQAENAYGGLNLPERLTIIKFEGEYFVGGEKSGSAYATAQKEHVNKLADKRIADLTGDSANMEQNKITINDERDAAIKLLDVKGQYADLAIEKMKAGVSPTEAKAAAEETFGAIPTDAGSQTGYNSGSVTGSLSAGNGGATVSNSNFKQFNELDCSYTDVSNYVDKSLDPKTKAFATSPNYSNSFKKTATKSAAKIKGEEEAACQTIFNDPMWEKTTDFKMTDLTSGIPTYGEFGKAMDDLGKKAGKQMDAFTDALYATMREGFCERLSTDYLGELAGDLIDDYYQAETKGTPLDGTKITPMDTESSQNNFTYTIIKNQSETSDSDLIKAMDASRDDQNKHQKSFMEDGLDDKLDTLEKRYLESRNRTKKQN